MANPNKRTSFDKAFTFINLNHIKGPRSLYYFHYVKLFQKNILGAFTKVHEEYDDIASFPWPMNSIIIYSPEFIKSVLVENSKSYIKGEQIEELRAVVGNGLATNNNHESWLKSRALLAREFNNKSISNFIDEFISLTNNKLDSFTIENSKEIEICHEMKMLTFEIACSTLLGGQLSDQDAKDVNEAVHYTSIVTYKRIFQFFPIPYWVPTITNFKFNNHYKKLNSIVLRLIKEAKSNTQLKHSVLQKLVHAKDEETNFSFSDDELRDEVLTMMLAGHETSAHTLTWILGLLAKNQSVQEKLSKQITDCHELDYSNLLIQIPYLNAVINESMRLYPAFPVLSRKTNTEIKLGNHLLPNKTNVVIPIYVTQRDDRYFQNAKEFLPERFLDGNLEKSFSFLPFSKGPRRCIAELFAMTEMSIIITLILKKYKLELIDNHFPTEEAFVSLKPVNGMPLKLTKK